MKEAMIFNHIESRPHAKKYRVFNRETREWWEGYFCSIEDLLKQQGWKKKDCWIRYYTTTYGWANLTPKNEVEA